VIPHGRSQVPVRAQERDFTREIYQKATKDRFVGLEQSTAMNRSNLTIVGPNPAIRCDVWPVAAKRGFEKRLDPEAIARMHMGEKESAVRDERLFSYTEKLE
jgi:hypothetical protein